MTERMKEILSTKKSLLEEATRLKVEKKFDEAADKLAQIKLLDNEYNVEQGLEQVEKTAAAADIPAKVPENKEKNMVNGFKIIAKMLKKQHLTNEEKDAISLEKALISGDNAVNGENHLIPEDIHTAITEFRKTYMSAKDYVSVIPTSTLSGSFTFEAGEPTGLIAFEDGGRISTGKEPTFSTVDYKIKHYGEIMPVSNILKDNEAGGLMAYLNRWFVRDSIITENGKIFDTLKKDKTPKALSGWQALKHSINTDVAADYWIDGIIITNQSGFAYLDDSVDASGRPILSDDVKEATKKRFNGLSVIVFPDAQLPDVEGKHPVFYGSLKAGCWFIERKILEFAVSEHIFFCENQTALRVMESFDVISADKNAYQYGLLGRESGTPDGDDTQESSLLAKSRSSK
mgnify:CR=1 FL=1